MCRRYFCGLLCGFVLLGGVLYAADAAESQVQLPIKYNPKTMSVEKYSQILSSYPGTNAALEAQAHLIAHEVYTQTFVDINASMQSLYQQYGSLSSMTRAVKVIASGFEERKDYAAVIPLYTEAINRLKDKVGQYWLQGSLVRAYIEAGQNDKADALVSEVLAKGLADSSNAHSLEVFLSPLNTDKTLPTAARVYTEALKAWGTFDLPCEYRCRIVKGYVQLKDYGKAMALARTTIQRDIDDPNNVQKINGIAQQMSKMGNKDEAAKVYQAVIEKHPEHAETHEAYEGLISNLQSLGKLEQAAQLVEDYIAKYAGKAEYMDPAGKHALFMQAAQQMVRRLQNRGQMDAATRLAEGLNAGAAGPTLESIRTLAVTRIKAGQLAEAADLTKKLLEEYPKDEAGALAVVDVANALREAGQMDTAMGMYDYAMGVAKGTRAEAMARAGRAMVYQKTGQDELVIQEVDAIIADANTLPDADKAVFVIGEEYYFKAHIDPNSCAILSNNGSVYLQRAITVWQRQIAVLPRADFTADAWYFRGAANRKLGKIENMILCYQTVLSFWPDYKLNWSAQPLVGWGYEALKKKGTLNSREADVLIEDAYRKTIERYPDKSLTPQARKRLISLYQSQGRVFSGDPNQIGNNDPNQSTK